MADTGISLVISIPSRSVTVADIIKLVYKMQVPAARNTVKQTTLPTCWNPEAEASSSVDSSPVSSEEDKPKGKPLMWTRVKSLAQIKTQKVMVYDAGEDLKFDRTLKVIRKELEHNRGQFVFDPADFKD